MIRVITGEKDSGKSTTFMRLYREEGGYAPGLYSKKLYEGDTICGYNLVLLPTLEEYEFISINNNNLEADTDKYYVQGRFVFLKEAFEIGKRHILNSPENSQVWIDEIGSLELNGKGHDSLLQAICRTHKEVIFTTRSYWVDEILKKYNGTQLSFN